MKRVFFLTSEALLWPFDKLVLFFWNQFSVRKIWLLRVGLVLWVTGSVTDSLMTGKTHGFVLAGVTLLVAFVFTLRAEDRARLSVRMQNTYAIVFRTFPVFYILRAVLLPPLLLLMWTTSWDSLTEMVNTVGWTLYFLCDDALQSEEPPKRWKFKLPKLVLFPEPLPQGA